MGDIGCVSPAFLFVFALSTTMPSYRPSPPFLCPSSPPIMVGDRARHDLGRACLKHFCLLRPSVHCLGPFFLVSSFRSDVSLLETTIRTIVVYPGLGSMEIPVKRLTCRQHNACWSLSICGVTGRREEGGGCAFGRVLVEKGPGQATFLLYWNRKIIYEYKTGRISAMVLKG